MSAEERLVRAGSNLPFQGPRSPLLVMVLVQLFVILEILALAQVVVFPPFELDPPNWLPPIGALLAVLGGAGLIASAHLRSDSRKLAAFVFSATALATGMILAVPLWRSEHAPHSIVAFTSAFLSVSVVALTEMRAHQTVRCDLARGLILFVVLGGLYLLSVSWAFGVPGTLPGVLLVSTLFYVLAAALFSIARKTYKRGRDRGLDRPRDESVRSGPLWDS